LEIQNPNRNKTEFQNPNQQKVEIQNANQTYDDRHHFESSIYLFSVRSFKSQIGYRVRFKSQIGPMIIWHRFESPSFFSPFGVSKVVSGKRWHLKVNFISFEKVY